MNLDPATENKRSIDHVNTFKEKTSSRRVNINTLIARYKKEKAKKKNETLIFVCLACAIVVISGILVSL